MKTQTPEQEFAAISDLGLTVTAIAYYLYRLAGKPNGDTFDGFNKWLAEQVMDPFEAIATQWAPEEEIADEQQ